MKNTLTISIDNNKYTVATNNNEDKIISAANLLNDAIKVCRDNAGIDNFSKLDVITFAALNIAEQQISNELYYKNQIDNLVNELSNINQYVNDLLDKTT